MPYLECVNEEFQHYFIVDYPTDIPYIKEPMVLLNSPYSKGCKGYILYFLSKLQKRKH